MDKVEYRSYCPIHDKSEEVICGEEGKTLVETGKKRDKPPDE
jgi:hypothetical protein